MTNSINKNLEKFAKDAGVILVDCGEGWGGRIGWATKDYPNSQFCGYRTENSAYKAWLNDTFGETTAKAILKLLKKGWK
jgi:hypothetical protein